MAKRTWSLTYAALEITFHAFAIANHFICMENIQWGKVD